MLHTKDSTEARRALLTKYMRGDLPKTATPLESIPRRTQEGPVPLSFGQQQIWLLNQFMPNIPVYNECVTIHLPGPLDVPALEQSFNEFIRRHEAWRTSFPIVDGLPVQKIHAPTTMSLPMVDLRHLSEAERQAEAVRLATEDARIPFDFAQGPLLRARLIGLGEQEHRLYLTLHHIIFDGVAIYQVFLPELRALYEAFASGKPSPLPEPSLQYADYAYWQREQLQGDILANQLGFWKQQLAGAPAALELPTDRPRPPVQTYHGSMQPFALSQRLTDELKALSHREGVTLYMILAASFQTLLYRYTGQEDILIGTATAGRNRAEFQKMMGFFLNTLVLRTNLSGNPPFRELLRRVREATIAAVTHEDTPFEYLVKELQPERNLAQNPLFQVLLTLEPPLPVLPSGWTLTQMDVTVGTSKFDLSLELDDRPEGLIGRFEYNTDLFDETTIWRMIGHWKTLLEGIVADVEQQLMELPLLTEGERQQLLGDWNATNVNYPKDICLHQLIEAQVQRTPDAVAVIFENEHLTYRELNRRANQLAHTLQRLGVGPEVLVGICMERSLEMMIALLGILKAGGAYVPLDPSFPSERLAYMLADSQARVLVTQQSLVSALPQLEATIVCLETEAVALAQQDERNVSTMTTAENLAYVIYTSGSTGRPKGVQIPHGAVVNFLLSMSQQPGLSAEDRWLAVTTLSFDIAALELFLPLLVGASVIVASKDVVTSGAALAESVSHMHATVMQATPITWRMMLAAGWQGDAHLKVLCGGEALPPELAQQLRPKVAALWNLYGPTETTIWSTVCEIKRGENGVTIGRPIANTQIYILSPELQPMPIGVPGELYIGGDGLARGYLHRPELTAERFIEHPFSKEPGARLYKTGDLARYRADGTIEHLGRLDYQVKLRGFRIELGEIEAVLSQHAEVQQAVVVAREDTPGDKRLVAYVVRTQQQSVTAHELQQHSMQLLPQYMVPSAVVFMETLPLTPNKKVDRGKLPAPNISQRTVEETFAIPTQPIHFQLIKIWEELLAARPIGITDNFFFLGGHSLLATRLVVRMEEVFGKKIPLATLFAQPTIEQLTKVLLGREAIHPSSPIVAVQASGTKRPFFYLHGDYKSGAFYCLLLARDLGSDQPFYALDPPKFDDLPFPSSLEEMAATNIQLIRTVQPEGPYLLGGFCNGGLIAYEMARQLHTQGENVDLLLSIDPTPVGYGRLLYRMVNRFGNLLGLSQHKQHYLFLWLRHAYRYLLHFYRYSKYPHYRGLQTELNAEQIMTEGGIVAALKSQFELQCGQGVEHLQADKQMVTGSKNSSLSAALRKLHSIFPDALLPPFETLSHDWEGMFHWSVVNYVPGPYPGKSTFFFFWDGTQRKKKWHMLAKVKDKEVEIHTVAGTHDTCKTEHLHHFTEQLHVVLSEAQAVTPDS